MKRIFVTGGAGFIGCNFIHYCLNKNNIVMNYDLLTYAGNLNNLNNMINKENYHFVNGDICNKDLLNSSIENFCPDFIINFAAESHVDLSIENPDSFINTNIMGTYNLLLSSLSYYKSLDAKDKKTFKLLHVSTDEVYGSTENGCFNENSSYNPSSPYSASKAASDHLVNAWIKTYGLPAIITNCSNNYGPYQFPEKLIPHMIQRCLQEKSLPVYGDGKNVRDWIYVQDNCKIQYKLLFSNCEENKYNIGASEEKNNLEVVELICEILDDLQPSKKLKTYRELIKFVEDRPGHDFRYAVDHSRVSNEFKWSPEVSFKEGLRNTIKWYLDNQEWINSIIDGQYSVQIAGLE